MLAYALRNLELLVFGPAVAAFGEANLLLAERLAVRRARILLVRRAIADVAVDDDQRLTVTGLAEGLEGTREHLQVVGIAHPRDVPAVADESRGDVVATRQRGVALDGDLVVVVDPTEV